MAGTGQSLTQQALPPSLDSWQAVLSCASCLRIAHQIRGRVRIRLCAPLPKQPMLRTLDRDHVQASLSRIRGLKALSANPLARSCVIEYDPDIIPDAAWPDLLAGRQTDAAATLAGILREKYEELKESGNGQL